MEPNPPTSDTTPSGRPRRITNRAIGDVATFVESTEEGGGKRLVFEIKLAPRGGNAMHIHLTQTESFKVLAGELRVSIRDQNRTLAVGDDATVTPGTRHRFFSESDEPTTFLVTVLEPGRFEDALRILYGLAGDGKVNKGGVPKNPLVIAMVSQWSDMYLASVPLGLQIAIFKPLAALARAMGYEKKLGVYLTAS